MNVKSKRIELKLHNSLSRALSLLEILHYLNIATRVSGHGMVHKFQLMAKFLRHVLLTVYLMRRSSSSMVSSTATGFEEEGGVPPFPPQELASIRYWRRQTLLFRSFQHRRFSFFFRNLFTVRRTYSIWSIELLPQKLFSPPGISSKC